MWHKHRFSPRYRRGSRKEVADTSAIDRRDRIRRRGDTLDSSRWPWRTARRPSDSSPIDRDLAPAVQRAIEHVIVVVVAAATQPTSIGRLSSRNSIKFNAALDN
jgi:hypothetical protein